MSRPGPRNGGGFKGNIWLYGGTDRSDFTPGFPSTTTLSLWEASWGDSRDYTGGLGVRFTLYTAGVGVTVCIANVTAVR